MDSNTYDSLTTIALYALNSKSRDLVCEAYGQAKMARKLEAITEKEYMELNSMLIRSGINNPQAGLQR